MKPFVLIFTIILMSCQSAATNPSQSKAVNDFAHWRGPQYNGYVDSGALVTDFDQKKNVLWATDLPGRSSFTDKAKCAPKGAFAGCPVQRDPCARPLVQRSGLASLAFSVGSCAVCC